MFTLTVLKFLGFPGPAYPHTPANLARAKGKEMAGLGGKKILLNKFSKALRPTGVECADNSWPFWSVTSLGSCTSREREGENVLMALAHRFEHCYFGNFLIISK